MKQGHANKKKGFAHISKNYLRLAALIIGSSLLLGLSAFTIQQYSVLSQQGYTIYQQRKTIESQHEQKEKILAENRSLSLTIDMLRDSVSYMKSEVTHLRGKLSKQEKVVMAVQTKLKSLLTDYSTVKQELGELKSAQQDKSDRFELLNAQKHNLQLQIEELNIIKAEEESQQKLQEQEMMAKQVREAKYMRLSNIIKNTKLRVQKIHLSKKKNGRQETNFTKSINNWRHTFIEFQLENEDMASLLDEQFIVKIVDADNYQILSYIESNPNFPDSDKDSKGVKFNFDGKLVDISYYNNQPKKGSNYEMQVYYIDDDGKEYLLTNGSLKFIEDKKMIVP